MHAVHHTAYVVHVMVEINAEATYIYIYICIHTCLACPVLDCIAR